MVTSKMFKMPLLKKAILLMSEIRDLIVTGDTSHNSSIRRMPLFKRIGQAEGIKKIIHDVFESVSNDQVLSTFYKGKNVEVLENKYFHYIVSLLDVNSPYVGKEIQSIHL